MGEEILKPNFANDDVKYASGVFALWKKNPRLREKL